MLERPLQMTETLPIARARNNHVPGLWHPPESAVTDLRRCFRNAVQLRLTRTNSRCALTNVLLRSGNSFLSFPISR